MKHRNEMINMLIHKRIDVSSDELRGKIKSIEDIMRMYEIEIKNLKQDDGTILFPDTFFINEIKTSNQI
jgi:hypothetical protein